MRTQSDQGFRMPFRKLKHRAAIRNRLQKAQYIRVVYIELGLGTYPCEFFNVYAWVIEDDIYDRYSIEERGEMQDAPSTLQQKILERFAEELWQEGEVLRTSVVALMSRTELEMINLKLSTCPSAAARCKSGVEG